MWPCSSQTRYSCICILSKICTQVIFVFLHIKNKRKKKNPQKKNPQKKPHNFPIVLLELPDCAFFLRNSEQKKIFFFLYLSQNYENCICKKGYLGIRFFMCIIVTGYEKQLFPCFIMLNIKLFPSKRKMSLSVHDSFSITIFTVSIWTDRPEQTV